jgi:hypothetical protein
MRCVLLINSPGAAQRNSAASVDLKGYRQHMKLPPTWSPWVVAAVIAAAVIMALALGVRL